MLEPKTIISQIILTPELAKDYLHKICPNNRRISEKLIAIFINEIKLNRWRLNNDTICFDTNGLMINGQHRCTAVVRANKNISVFVATNMPNESFSVMDTGKKRTGKDIMEIMGCRNSGVLAGALKHLFFYLNNTLTLYGGGPWGKGAMVNQDFIDIYNKYPDIIKFVNQSKVASNIISPQIGLFCNYVFHRADETLSEIFMEGFYKGTNLDNDNIMLVLRNRLIKDREAYTHLKSQQKIALIFRTWNYFFHNKKVAYLVMPVTMPIVAGDKLLNNNKPMPRHEAVKKYAEKRSIEMEFQK